LHTLFLCHSLTLTHILFLHYLSHSLSHTVFPHTLFLCYSVTLSLTYTHIFALTLQILSHSHTDFLSHPLSHTLSFALFLPDTLFLSLSVSLSHTPTLFFTHTHTQTLFLSHTLYLSHSSKDIRCQFHQHFMYKFFVQMSFFYVHVTRKSCQNLTFVQKIRMFNVDEIDGRSFSKRWLTCFYHKFESSRFDQRG